MNNLSVFLKNIYTQTDALRRLRILKERLSARLFSSDASQSSFIKQEDLDWLESLDKEFIQSFDQKNLSQLISDLETQVKQITPLVIYIPFDLPYAELEKLGIYLRGSQSEIFLIEIKLDPELGGGCALVWKGIYKDYSVRKKIEEEKSALLEVFSQYTKG